MIRKYSFIIRFNIKRNGVVTNEGTVRSLTVNAADDLEAFTCLCRVEWYQNIDYDQNVIVTMSSEDIPIRKA